MITLNVQINKTDIETNFVFGENYNEKINTLLQSEFPIPLMYDITEQLSDFSLYKNRKFAVIGFGKFIDINCNAIMETVYTTRMFDYDDYNIYYDSEHLMFIIEHTKDKNNIKVS